MTRILADLPADDIDRLDVIAREQGKSRAAVLREAVRAYTAVTPAGGSKDWIARGAGYWKHRHDIGDPLDGPNAPRGQRHTDGEG